MCWLILLWVVFLNKVKLISVIMLLLTNYSNITYTLWSLTWYWMLIISVLLCLLLPSCYVGTLMFTCKGKEKYFTSIRYLLIIFVASHSYSYSYSYSYANNLLYFMFSPRQPVRVRYCGVVARSVHLFSHMPSLLARSGTKARVNVTRFEKTQLPHTIINI